MCRKKLEDYPRTVAGDEALLERSDLTVNQHHALQVTLNEKKTLHSLIEVCEQIRDWILSSDLKTTIKVMRKKIARKELTPSIDSYLLLQLLPMLDEQK